jgi:HNH endonuclease
VASVKTPKRSRTSSNEKTEARLRELVGEMRTIPSDGSWYALTLTATADGRREHSWYSGFAGFTKKRPRRELRAPSQVDPQKMAALWAELGMPCWVVRNRAHLALYIRFGGTCLVARDVAESALADWMQPLEVGVVAAVGPSKTIGMATPEELQHAPTPKLRAAILKRDDYRCLACGRRPATNPDIELHVHHVVPFSEGGLTTRSNLMTLCHTCHNGLDPHRELKMWELLAATEPVVFIPEPDEELRRYREGVKRHRELISKLAKRLMRNYNARHK